jgi:hypothetical protein
VFGQFGLRLAVSKNPDFTILFRSVNLLAIFDDSSKQLLQRIQVYVSIGNSSITVLSGDHKLFGCGSTSKRVDNDYQDKGIRYLVVLLTVISNGPGESVGWNRGTAPSNSFTKAIRYGGDVSNNIAVLR